MADYLGINSFLSTISGQNSHTYRKRKMSPLSLSFCLAYTKLELSPSMGYIFSKKIVACCEFVLLSLMLFLSCRHGSPKPMNYGSYLIRLQNLLLKRTLRGEHYLKLYSYRYLVNGFAVVISPQQVPYFLYFVPCATFLLVPSLFLVYLEKAPKLKSQGDPTFG